MTRPDLFLEKAKRALLAAEHHLTEGDTDFAASKIYYACFYAATALLATRDLQFSRHGQVIAQYGLHFSKTRLLDPRFHKLLDTTFELRRIGDYQVEVPIEPKAISDLIPECRQFISAAAEYLVGLGDPDPTGA